MKLSKFALYSWSVLGYNILVILWGAFVRATGSGAGCGSHWPSCNGTIIPWSSSTATLIEFTHRLTSGLALILVIVLLVWAFRSYPAGHQVRFGAKLSLFFIIVEALVGAVLVLFELVAYDTSLTRAVVAAIHLANTFILLSVLTLTAWWATGGPPVSLKGPGKWGLILWAGYAGLLVLGASGAVTALGDTLFPARSLGEGLQQDLSPTAHLLVRLRLFHPLIAIGVGAYLIIVATIFNTVRPTPTTPFIAKSLTAIYLVQLVAGAINVVLLAPIWLQLVHLLLADLVLIIWTLFMINAFSEHSVQPQTRYPAVSLKQEAYNPPRR